MQKSGKGNYELLFGASLCCCCVAAQPPDREPPLVLHALESRAVPLLGLLLFLHVLCLSFFLILMKNLFCWTPMVALSETHDHLISFLCII